MKRYPSIFNDALAPVTPGPSSSNTCGPARIARTCRRLFGEKPCRVELRMSNAGNYKPSFLGMRTDLAFLTGFLDRDVTHPRFIHAHADAEAEGIVMETIYTDDLPGFPTALAEIVLCGESGRKMSFHTVSCGGGAFNIDAVNGCRVMITGECYETLLFVSPVFTIFDESMLKSKIRGFLSLYRETPTSAVLEIKSTYSLSADAVNMLRNTSGVEFVASAEPIHPVVPGVGKEPPFTTSAEFIQYADGNRISLWEAAIEYESSISGWSRDEILSRASSLWKTVLQSVEGGLMPGNDMNGITHAVAPRVKKGFESKKLIPLGAINVGAPVALSIMEYSNCSGVVVCIPTGGSSGVVPGAILGAAGELNKSEEECVRAFLVAGLMGVFMEKTHYLGSYGCQMEIGLAAGMASAGLIEMLGGTAAQASSAAVMCLQSLSGILCDKIAGLVQVPCLSRNMTATAIAMVCANAAMCGVETLVPLEEKMDSMMIVGKKLIDEGINRMGDMGTPTGKRLATEQKMRDAKLR